jgi:hypothetical protein
MTFEYLVKIKKESSINIEDIGNCALDVFNDLGFEWVLLIKTVEGTTQIVEFGPTLADIDYPPAKVNYSYDRIDFSESKIINRIQKFLTDGYRNVTQAFEITQEEAKEKMKNLVDYLYDSK